MEKAPEWKLELERLTALTDEQVAAEVSSAVYAATGLVERLETVGRITGNGHHIRQDIAAYAARVVLGRLRPTDAGEG